MHEVLVNRLGGLSLPRKSVARLTDRPDMTLDAYRGCKPTMQQQQQKSPHGERDYILAFHLSCFASCAVFIVSFPIQYLGQDVAKNGIGS